jgi:hypothetical protein
MEFWVAIPDSILLDTDTIEEKSRKIALIARAIAIFKVSRIIIYNHKGLRDDKRLLKLVLEFMNTPPYLRKKVYKLLPELKMAGRFEPLNTPHHKAYKRLDEIKVGEIRQGLVVKKDDMLYIDLGLDKLIPLKGYNNKASIVNVVFTSPYPDLECKIISKDMISEYWGYDVIFYNRLSTLLDRFNDCIILTSRKGKPIYRYEEEIVQNFKDKSKVIIVFGSIKEGVFEILRNENYKLTHKHVYNFLPDQGVSTIRVEEAILGSLSVLNYIMHKY